MPTKTFRYRLYPTKAQAKSLCNILSACRWTYNKTLEVRKEAWELRKEHLSYYDAKKLLPHWKDQNAFLRDVHSQVLQNAAERVERSFKSFFRRVKLGEKPGYPRFKGPGRYNSFTFTQSGFRLDGDRLNLSKVGRLKVVVHRPIEGTIKTLTIYRTSTNKWFANFACQVPESPLPANTTVVGIDLGLHHFAMLSSGESIANPRFFRLEERALAKVQRRHAKQSKGTPSRNFHRKAVALTHERIVNKRRDFCHKLSHRLVRDFGLLCFEDLDVKSMARGHLAKSIFDASWRQLITFTTNKAACAGRSMVVVNPRNTSKLCSQCGTIVEKDLSVRIHTCTACGLSIDRDLNAAKNILRLGLQSLGTVAMKTSSVSCEE